MDYHSLPRKQLQALCKMHSIPANSTNISMADALAALFNVEENTKPSGHEGFQKQEISSDDRSGSVLTDIFNTPRTNTRGKRHAPEAQDENAEELGLSSSALKPKVVKSAGTASGRRRRVEAIIENEITGDSKVKTRTRGRPKNTISEAMINKEESLHSSEVDEASDAVAVQTSSVKAKRGRPRRVVRGILSSKKTSRQTDSEEENNQASDEKEETVETNDESVEAVPKAMVKGLERPQYLQNERQPRKKSGQVEDENALAESTRVEDDASKGEVTPAFKRSTRAKAAKVVDVTDRLVGTRSSARKKAGNVDSVKKMPGTSSMMSPTTKTRRTKMPGMMINVSDNENEDFPVEKAAKVSSKKKPTAKTHVRTRRMLRSCPQDSEESIIEGVLEESVAQETSTRQVQNPVENRQQMLELKKQEQPSSEREESDVRQNAVSSRKTMKIATENLRNVAHTCIEEYQVLAADIKVEKVKEVGEEVHVDVESREKIASEEANGGVKILIQAQNMLSSCKQDYHEPAVHLFEESACKVKQIHTQRGQNPVQNIHEVVDSEKQGQQSSELITTKTTRKQQGKVPSRCIEECQVVAIDLKAEPVKGVDADELSVYREAVEHFDSVEIDGGILVQEPKLCEDCNERTRLQDISEAAGTEQVENKSMVKVNGKKNHRSSVCQSLLKETCHSGEVNGQNVFWLEGSIKGRVQDVCLHEEEPYNAMWSVCPYVAATHVTRPIEGEFCSLLTTVNSQMVEVKESCFLEHQTVCMAEKGTCAEQMARDTCASSVDAKHTFTSKVEAQDLETSTINNGKSQETEDKDGVENSGGIQESNFWDQQTVCMAGERTRAKEMAKDTCASSGEVQDPEASILNSGKSQETEGEDGMGISGGSCIQQKAEHMHVDFNAEADIAFPNAINSRNVEEVKGILVPHDKRSKDLRMQQLDACGLFSFLAGKATANPVSGRTEFLHIDMVQNVSEAQGQGVTELDNAAGQHMNSSEEEYLDIETVLSNDFNFLGDQHMPRNPVDEINDNAVEPKLQVIYNSSFLIDGVRETISSDLDNTEEEDDQLVQKFEDCVHGAQNTSEFLQQSVTNLATVESQELGPSKQFDSIEGNLYTVTVCSNDYKEQTHVQHDSMYPLGETNASTIKEKLEVACIDLLGVGKIHEELSTGLSATEKDRDALDRAVEGQHAWQNCSFSISGGVTDRLTNCEGAGFAVSLTDFPTQATDETHIEKLCCVLDAKVDQSQGSMVEEIVQGLQSLFEPETPKSPLTEELIYCKLEESSIVCDNSFSKSEVQDFKNRLFVGESQGSICTFEDGKQDAPGKVISINNSHSVQKQLAVGTQNCGSWQPTEKGRHTSDQVSDDQTLIAVPETCNLEDAGPVSQSVANIELLKLKVMPTMESSIPKNQIEDQIARTLEKELPEIEAQGVEHAILEMKFADETNDDGKNSTMVQDTGFLRNPVAKCEMDNAESSLTHPWKAPYLGKSELAIMSDISPCLNSLDEKECSDINCTSFDENFQQLSGNEEGLTKASLSDHTSTSLIGKQSRDFHGEDDAQDFFPTEGHDEYMKWPGNLRNVSIEIPDQVRGQEESIIRDDGLQIEHLEQAGCKLQVQTQEKMHASTASELLDLGTPVSINDQRLGIQNSSFRGSKPLQVKEGKPLDLNTMSFRKLRALFKEKIRIKEAEKVGKRPALQELSSNALDQRENVPGNSRLFIPEDI